MMDMKCGGTGLESAARGVLRVSSFTSPDSLDSPTMEAYPSRAPLVIAWIGRLAAGLRGHLGIRDAPRLNQSCRIA